MIRILHIIQSMNAGGMETMIMNFYREIDRSKFQFDFLISDFNHVFFEEEIKKLGGKIYRVNGQHPHFFKNRIEVKNFFLNNKYDVVHCHQGITYFYPLKMAKKYNVSNRIIHNHGINRNFLRYLCLYNNLYAKKRICGLANKYIACSSMVLDHLFTKNIINSNNYFILRNAINVKKYKYDEISRKKIRKKYNLKNNKVFIHIGTFTTPKNHKFLIDIFRDYLKLDPNSTLLLIGEGPLMDKIKIQVNSNNIQDKVVFLGVRSDINEFLSAADVMLFPSIYEGLPLTLIEAQANGIQILASKNISEECNISDLIYFISIKEQKKWVQKMLDIKLNRNREKYNNLIEKTPFSVTKAVKDLEIIYEGKK